MKNKALAAVVNAEGHDSVKAVNLEAEVALARLALRNAVEVSASAQKTLRKLPVRRQVNEQGKTVAVFPAARSPQGMKLDDTEYRIRKVSEGTVKLVGGGEVVGAIPEGLPKISAPSLELDKLSALFSAALVISLVGFMEAISIAKAVAARTKQRLNPNQDNYKID